MSKKLALFLVLSAALSVNSLAQNVPGFRSELANFVENDNKVQPDPLARPRFINVKAAAVESSVNVNTSAEERTAFDMVNRVRGERGLAPLAWNDGLAAISRSHSQNMAELKFFSHKGRDNKMVSDRADELGMRKWRSIGENIAFNRGYQDPIGKAVELWLGSPSHRRNLLDPNWEESAIGIAIAPDGSYYLTQVFWVRN